VNDESVMEEVRSGDVARLEVLFDRHYPAIVRYFHYLSGDRALSEDLAQEVFFRVLKYRQSFQPGGSFRAWLYQIARNVHTGQAGRHKAEVAMPEEAGELAAAAVPQDRALERKQETEILHRALAALPGDKRELLIMSRFLDLKYEEIAGVLECEVGTVKVRVYRAMRDLSQRFFALCGERAS
jgi:RNA polymerase sigma-70 factor (ECF subfamily)